jgi:cell division protein FtsB
MTLAETSERLHQEIEAYIDEKSTVDVQIDVQNKELVLLMARSKAISDNIEKLSDVIPILKELEEADR